MTASGLSMCPITILGAYAYLHEAPISFVMSVCLYE